MANMPLISRRPKGDDSPSTPSTPDPKPFIDLSTKYRHNISIRLTWLVIVNMLTDIRHPRYHANDLRAAKGAQKSADELAAEIAGRAPLVFFLFQ